jgi:hypothetical protein
MIKELKETPFHQVTSDSNKIEKGEICLGSFFYGSKEHTEQEKSSSG